MSETRYAKIIDEQTKEVQVGVGCTDEYYIEIGMTLMDVDIAYNGRYYVTGYAPAKPKPTKEEKEANVRAVRDSYINDIEWRVSRYRDQVELEISTSDTHETYIKILEYMQYLRDYPESSADWYEHNPLDFESWCHQ